MSYCLGHLPVQNTSVSGGSAPYGYLYNATGTRTAKGTLSTLSCDVLSNGFTPTTIYMLGLGGEQLAEFSGAGTWVHTNVFAGGKLLATYSATDNDTHFPLADWLGTKRAELTTQGKLSTFYSLPFGNGLQTGGAGLDATEHHFTGKERDTESGNDYFGARYYASSMGRFMSPDWSAKEDPVPYAVLDDPQSLNLYAYVRNNPLIRLDADGHVVVEHLEYTSYAVEGENFDQALANANTHFSGTDAGQTRMTLGVTYQPSVSMTQSGGNATVTATVPSDDKITTNLSQTIELPTWKSSNPAEQAKWDKMAAKLKTHEETHAADNKAVAEKLDKSLPGTNASATSHDPQAAANAAGDKLEGKVNAKVNAAGAEAEKRKTALDDKTNHGRNP